MSETRTQTLKVEGMVCDACVRHVTNALMGLSGVKSADVSLSNKHALVAYDPARVDSAQMISAIADEGYEASPLLSD